MYDNLNTDEKSDLEKLANGMGKVGNNLIGCGCLMVLLPLAVIWALSILSVVFGGD